MPKDAIHFPVSILKRNSAMVSFDGEKSGLLSGALAWLLPVSLNSSQLPVGFTDDVLLSLELQNKLQKKHTSDAVLQLYMGKRMSSAETCKKLVRRALENFCLLCFAITPTFSRCSNLSGEHVSVPSVMPI